MAMLNNQRVTIYDQSSGKRMKQTTSCSPEFLYKIEDLQMAAQVATCPKDGEWNSFKARFTH
jgi:hypothetical protein